MLAYGEGARDLRGQGANPVGDFLRDLIRRAGEFGGSDGYFILSGFVDEFHEVRFNGIQCCCHTHVVSFSGIPGETTESADGLSGALICAGGAAGADFQRALPLPA